MLGDISKMQKIPCPSENLEKYIAGLKYFDFNLLGGGLDEGRVKIALRKKNPDANKDELERVYLEFKADFESKRKLAALSREYGFTREMARGRLRDHIKECLNCSIALGNIKRNYKEEKLDIEKEDAEFFGLLCQTN